MAIAESSTSAPNGGPAAAATASPRIKEARQLMATDPARAEQIYREVVASQPSVTSDAAIREYETALVALGERYRDQRCVFFICL